MIDNEIYSDKNQTGVLMSSSQEYTNCLQIDSQNLKILLAKDKMNWKEKLKAA